MTAKGNAKLLYSGLTLMAVLLCLSVFCAASPQDDKGKDGNVVAGEGNDPERVYLIHADELFYDEKTNADAQILNGNVAFRHKGATLYCDSAHFYEASNSFEAFNNVKMYQGDTLSLFSDYAYYDGDEMMAMARYNVVLKNKESTLYTDSLNYDRLYEIGYFFEGGRLEDNGNTLTSDWGEYHTATRDAIFNYNVKLKGDNFFLTTDTLYYDTEISMAHALGPSNITSDDNKIYTENGYYDTKTESSRLYDRSVVNDNGKILIGDSIFHDAVLGTNEAFMNVIYTDTVNKNRLLCDYCWYDEPIGYGMATINAVAIDFSQQDTLYLHADTFKVFTFNINTDSVYRVAHAYNKVRAYRVDVQAVCDSLVYNSQDTCLTMYRDPIIWDGSQQLLGEVIKIYMNDSTIDRAHVINQALSVEQLDDSIHYNQIASTEMFAYFDNGDIYETDAVDNVHSVYYPIDDSDSSLILMAYAESSLLKAFIEDKKMQKVWMPKTDGMLYPMTQIPKDKEFLENFAWFDYVRPLSKEDIFNWRGKKAEFTLKETKRREPPMPHLKKMPAAEDSIPLTAPGMSGVMDSISQVLGKDVGAFDGASADSLVRTAGDIVGTTAGDGRVAGAQGEMPTSPVVQSSEEAGGVPIDTVPVKAEKPDTLVLDSINAVKPVAAVDGTAHDCRCRQVALQDGSPAEYLRREEKA